MNKTSKQRLPWSTPELRRIDAGSAESANDTATKNDGGGAGDNKS